VRGMGSGLLILLALWSTPAFGQSVTTTIKRAMSLDEARGTTDCAGTRWATDLGPP
jgi:hypothetical protein